MPHTQPLPAGRRQLVTVYQAAEYFGCGHQLIRRMIYSGKLTGYRLGSRAVRVDLDELDRLMTKAG